MLSEIFYWVMNASIIGSIAGVIVLIMRKIKHIPRFAIYALWLLPFIRFWLPFGIANKYSLLSLISKITSKTVAISEGSIEVSVSNYVMGAKSYFPFQYKNSLTTDIFNIASVIWIIISAAAILTCILLYAFTKSALKNSEHLSGIIYKSDKITVPAVYGIIRPRILIPSAVVYGDTNYIIMHERVHIRRKDNLFRVLAVITVCIHWFNPLAWVFLKFYFEDMEHACDAKVLKGLDKNESRDYARAILSCASGKAIFASAFGGASTMVRIENILSYKKLTILSTLLIAALTVIIAIMLITNAYV